MQTFYLSYKLLQTMFMAVVFLSLIFSLLLLFLLYELRPYMWKCYRNWNSFLFFFLFLLLNHLAYSFHQINNGEKYYELLPVPIVILWCIVGIVDFLLVRESIHLKKKMKENLVNYERPFTAIYKTKSSALQIKRRFIFFLTDEHGIIRKVR